MSFKTRYTREVAVCVALLLTPVAMAQTSDRSATDTGRLEEIIVTALKREQPLQDVPASVAAVTGKTLEDAGVSGIQELAQVVPGLQFAETIGRQTTNPSIRGVTPFGFADPTVQVLVDGYTNGFSRSGNNVALLDLERVEVLKGPQPTLYGRNALGGVLNYVTRAPQPEFRSTLLAEFDERGSYRLQASASGALIGDSLLAGLAIGYRDAEGFLDNTVGGAKDVNDEEDMNARLRLRYLGGEALEVNLTVDYNEADDAAGDPAHVPPAFYSPMKPTLTQVAAGQVNFNNFTRTIQHDILGGFDREDTTVVLNVAYDFGATKLVSITGIGNQETDIRTDVTRTPGPSFFGNFFSVKIDLYSWSQELRLMSQDNDRFNWLVGAYVFSSESNRLLAFDGGAPNQDTTVESDNWAVFVNGSIRLGERWTLAGGLRYDVEDRLQRNNLTRVAPESDAEEVLPSLSLSYKPKDGLHFYGLVSRGSHAGAPNAAAAIAAGAPPKYDSEYMTNYEFGIKGTSDDGRWSYETAIFLMDWSDQQIQSTLTPLLGFISNAGKSEVKGLEVAARYRPTDRLDLSVSMSALDAKYKNYFDPINTAPFGLSAELGGNDMIYAPDLAASLSAQYVRPIATGGWKLRLRGDVNYTGERPFDVTNLLIADAYTIVNLYAGIQNESYEVGVYGNNVLDEDFLTGGILPSTFFPPLLTIGDPRTFGVRATVRF